MSLWQVILACAFAWISGALISASFRDGFIKPGSDHDLAYPFAEHATYPQSSWRWLKSPALLVQLVFLVAFLAAAVALIVVNI
jgi:hypothetical protein